MGHIQYFLQYKDKPLIYRDGANPGNLYSKQHTVYIGLQKRKQTKKRGHNFFGKKDFTKLLETH